MPKVRFMPFDKECEATEGQTLLDVALSYDIPIQHACGGFCSCTTCHVHVQEGHTGLAPQDEDEKDTITRADELTENSRLACQSKVIGDVVVKVVNIDD